MPGATSAAASTFDCDPALQASGRIGATSERIEFDSTAGRFGCLLLPGFSMFDLSSVVDTLRLANVTARRKLYSWHLISSDGAPVAASTGITVRPDATVEPDAAFQAVIVCGGDTPKPTLEGVLLDFLRRMDHLGVVLGATGNGSYALASAGLLEGYRCTIHWQDHSVLVGDFPGVRAQASLFEIDRGRLTAAGGMATLGMMVALVGHDNGWDFALAVADKLLLPEIPQPRRPSSYPLWRMSTTSDRPDRVRDVFEIMSANVARPLSNEALGARVNLSARQVERLVRRYFGTSPGRLYRELRLQQARWFLRHTTLSVAKVAAASGFHSASHFGRVYRGVFGHLPGQERVVYSGKEAGLP